MCVFWNAQDLNILLYRIFYIQAQTFYKPSYSMFLLFIQKTMMTIKKKQFSEIIKSHENNMYYFDIKKIISTILSSIWTLKVFHIDITKIVNNSFEYWHSFSWKLSIWIYSQNYVTYFDLTFIFFFDFVRFKHVNKTKTQKCIEQIIFFDRNRKS